MGFEKMLAKFEEDQKQDADIKVSELSCENSEENKDNESAKKGPIRFSFRVCSTASAKASSRFCSNDEVKPANDGTVVAGPDGKPIAVPKPVVAEADLAEPVVVDPVVAKPVELVEEV